MGVERRECVLQHEHAESRGSGEEGEELGEVQIVPEAVELEFEERGHGATGKDHRMNASERKGLQRWEEDGVTRVGCTHLQWNTLGNGDFKPLQHGIRVRGLQEADYVFSVVA